MSVLGDNELETDDLYLASYLMVSQCVLLRRRKSGPTKIYFVFSNPAGNIRDLREAYFSGKAVVKAHDYAGKIQAMKELLFSG